LEIAACCVVWESGTLLQERYIRCGSVSRRRDWSFARVARSDQ